MHEASPSSVFIVSTLVDSLPKLRLAQVGFFLAQSAQIMLPASPCSSFSTVSEITLLSLRHLSGSEMTNYNL